MSTRTLPWEVLSKDAKGLGTSEEVIKQCGLDFRVEIQDMFLAGKPDADGIPVLGKKVNKRRGVVRMDTGDCIGCVGNNYHVIQNAACFGFFDHLVEDGKAEYLRAGETEDGSKVFIVARLCEDFKVGPDDVARYLILKSSHDGLSSVHVDFVPCRLVCINGLVAELEGLKRSVKIVHTSNHETAMAKARKVIGTADHYYKQLEIVCNKLFDQKFSDSQMEDYIEKVYPLKPNAKNSKRNDERRAKVLDLFQNSDTLKNVRGTKWAAWNSVTEHTDHFRTRVNRKKSNQDEIRFKSELNGQAANLKSRALNILLSTK